MVRWTSRGTERVRSADYGAATPSPAETVQQLASAPTDDSVLNVEDVARLTADAILANRLYVLPHRASRDSIRRASHSEAGTRSNARMAATKNA